MKTLNPLLITAALVLFARTDVAAVQGAPEPADRVGFPQDYRTSFKLLGTGQGTASPEIWTTYGNAAAASVTQAGQLPYPNGSVLLMEFANAARDGMGELLRDAKGQLVKGEIMRVDVMRREAGYGAGYGEARAGEWEFASYLPDGKIRIPSEKAGHCAACHQKVGAEKDYVHKIRVPGGAEAR